MRGLCLFAETRQTWREKVVVNFDCRSLHRECLFETYLMSSRSKQNYPTPTAQAVLTAPELLRRAMHLLAVWTPAWTPDMQALQEQVDALLVRTAHAVPPSDLELSMDELRAKAARYDRFKELAELASAEPGGGIRVGDRLFATFDEAFDAEMDEAAKAAAAGSL